MESGLFGRLRDLNGLILLDLFARFCYRSTNTARECMSRALHDGEFPFCTDRRVLALRLMEPERRVASSYPSQSILHTRYPGTDCAFSLCIYRCNEKRTLFLFRHCTCVFTADTYFEFSGFGDSFYYFITKTIHALCSLNSTNSLLT